YRERVGLAWQLTWPTVLVDIGMAFLLHVMLEVQTQGAELLSEIPNLLIVAPWLVRRMMRREHPGFQLKTLRDGVPVQMNYTESFTVMWLLSWRTIFPMLALLLFVSFFLRFLHVQLSTLVPSSQEAPFLNAVGVSVLESTAGVFLMPLIMPGLFHK